MRSSSLKQGRVQGTLAQRGIAVVVVESWAERVIVQCTVAQIGWCRNLTFLGGYMITSVAVTAIEKNCKELVV